MVFFVPSQWYLFSNTIPTWFFSLPVIGWVQFVLFTWGQVGLNDPTPPPSIPNEILCVHPWTQNIQPLRRLMSSWVKHPHRGWETACHHAPSLPPVPPCLQPLLYGCFWDFQGAAWQRCLFQGWASTERSLHLPLSPVMNLCNNQHPLPKRASLNKALPDARLWARRWRLRRQWKGASLLSKTKTALSAYDLHSHEHLTRFTGGEQNSLLASGATNLHRMRLVTPTTAILLLNILSCLEQYRVDGKYGDKDKHLTLKEVFHANDVKIITD